MAGNAARRRRASTTFFAIVFLLSIPFWLVSAITRARLSADLPLSALMAVCPALAATILTSRGGGASGVAALLKRPFHVDWVGSGRWFIAAALLPIAIATLTYAMLGAAGAPRPRLHFPPGAVLATSLAFLIAASFEELGWSGYATDPLQTRVGALRASIVIGVVWAIWHWVPLLQAHRPPTWIGWWSFGTVGQRVLIVWLYNRARSGVLAAVLFHAMMNFMQVGPLQSFGPGGYPLEAIRASSLAIAVAAVLVSCVPGRRGPGRRHSSA
jgi:membrane protease YdiL (CAAX protease family)